MQVYSCAELMSTAHALGGRVDFESGLPDALPVLAGWQQVQSMDSGLVLYLSRSQDMVGGRSQNCLPAGLTASFLLQGQAEVVITNQRLQMDSRRAGSPAMLVHLREEEAFQRHWQAGREETKVSLHLGQDWLSRQLDGIASAGLTRLRLSHARNQAWQPPAPLLRRAAALFGAETAEPPLLASLQRESFALEVAASVVRSVIAEREAPAPSAHLRRCVDQLQQWLQSGEADGLTINQMARRLGTNAVDLQSTFQQLHGSSIAAWLRALRLQRAHDALLQRRVSVDVAASLAGYDHTSSFSAAFKRQFGRSPSQIR
ncbi:helix-turn-helix transcriptional regulator [Stenotrophomonas riyadhensis]